uniref:Mitochondria-eating protein n=1 Tax=Setaria digitata TaxID=48799 RepID=A0A915PZG7_9BILA
MQSQHYYQISTDDHSQVNADNNQDEIERLKFKIKRLYKDMFKAQRQIQSMIKKEEKVQTTDKFLEQENSFNNPMNKGKINSNSIYKEISKLIEKFAKLYDEDGMEILKILKEIPEFHGHTQLQHQIIMSIIVISYCSVEEKVERRREMIFEILDDQPFENEDNENLNNAIYRYISRKALGEYGISNIKI